MKQLRNSISKGWKFKSNIISIFEELEIKYYRFIQNSTEYIGDDGWRVFNSLADGDEFVHSFLHPQWGLVSSSDSASTNEASWMLLLLGLIRMMRALLMRWCGVMHLVMIIGNCCWYRHSWSIDLLRWIFKSL